MSRGPGSPRCVRCRQIVCECICALLSSVPTRTHLCFVVHRAELHKPTATGLFARLIFPNLSLWVHGRENESLPPVLWPAGTRPVVLFPSDDAVPIEEWALSEPLSLVVPDGTWGQAKRMPKRIPALRDLPRVALRGVTSSLPALRTRPKAEHFGTLEAVAMALEMLEGEAVGEQVRANLRAHLRATLSARGTIKAAWPTDLA